MLLIHESHQLRLEAGRMFVRYYLVNIQLIAGRNYAVERSKAFSVHVYVKIEQLTHCTKGQSYMTDSGNDSCHGVSLMLQQHENVAYCLCCLMTFDSLMTKMQY